MRLTAWLPLAVLSALAALGTAATRPRYGGTLRVEIRAAPASLDPTVRELPPLASLVFEPLIQLDAAGAPVPHLVLSWQHDSSAKRWQFNLRPGVRFHDGLPLVPGAVVASLQAALPGLSISASTDSVIIRAEHPMPGLLFELAHNGPVFAHDAAGGFTGTGPFRLASWTSGHSATFAANDDYWAGRPFLDAVEVQMGRGQREQLVDLEIGRTDIAELGPGDMRRASERGGTVWTSEPINLIALEIAPGRVADPRVRRALALSIDRAAMRNVLLQKQGDITAALLPQWLSGYAFAFDPAPDVARARALAAAVSPQDRTVALAYDPAVTAGRSLAERIAINARDAGLTVQVSTQNPQADLRLTAVRVASLDPSGALARFATDLGLEPPARQPSYYEVLYDNEKKLLDDFRAVPLFHLPDMYVAAPRVHLFSQPPIARLGEWRFENLWLSGTSP
jgi:peptide/nickel transport system substrate-binding protein